MQNQLDKIINILEKKLSSVISLKFEKNVYSVAMDLKNELNESDKKICSIKDEGNISSDETNRIHTLCRRILSSYYSFRERLNSFCNKELRDQNIKLNPSFCSIDDNLIRARGKSTHVKEAIYKYQTDDDEIICCTSDVFSQPYEGVCINIKVSFIDENENIVYETTFDDLINDIKFSINYTLNKFENSLKTMLID